MRMAKVAMVMMLAVSAGLPAVAMAQRKPLPAVALAPEDLPYKNWDALAQVFSGWHGKVLVATVAQPKKFVRCTVKELTASGVTCKGKFGKSVVYGREQIAAVAARHESGFEWGDLAGVGFVAAIGGSAGYGVAVLASIGGAALVAAAPLALVALAGGAALVAVSALFAGDAVNTFPERVLYEKPEDKMPAARADGLVAAS